MGRLMVALGFVIVALAAVLFGMALVKVASLYSGPGAAATAGGDAAVAAAPHPGAELFQTRTCLTCHGADGKTPILPEYPHIAGQSAAYALQQMRDIKSGARSNGMTMAMKGIMHLVEDSELEVLADYIATLEPASGPGADPDSEGAKLFQTRTCFTCHGADGKTPILPEYPHIAGQSAAYALQQMRDIKSGARSNGMTMAMKGIMHLVSDEELELLAKHISNL